MPHIRITKGFNIPLAADKNCGTIPHNIPRIPEAILHTGQFAICIEDYRGCKPEFFPEFLTEKKVKVKQGQPVFFDKRFPEVLYTAPESGKFLHILRGEKRKPLAVVFEKEDYGHVSFPKTTIDDILNPEKLSPDAIKKTLCKSGLFAALRRRPFDTVARPSDIPRALFITAADTNPLAPDPLTVIQNAAEYFRAGVGIVSRLTSGNTFLITGRETPVPGNDCDFVQQLTFTGPHPSGNPGTHIHFLFPVSRTDVVWHIGYQDVINIGETFLTGKLSASRVLSLAGSASPTAGLLRTVWGSSVSELLTLYTSGSGTQSEPVRVISGSVLDGRRVDIEQCFLGRFHRQITLLPEDDKKKLLGWAMPGFGSYSLTRTFMSSFIPFFRKKMYRFTSDLQGDPRAFVPVGLYDKLMPLDVLPAVFLRALVSKDYDLIEKLGGFDLGSEDLALCTFAAPGKADYGALLTAAFDAIEKEST